MKKFGILNPRLFMAVLLLLFVIGCNNSSSTVSPATGLAGTLTEAGSTTVQPLAEKLAQAFEEINPNVKIEIQGGGSSVGVRSTSDGVVDIGAISRELQPNEPALVTTLIALDGVAIVVNPNNPVSNLSTEQLRDIYAGTIVNWKEVGGNDEEIIIVSREDGSGTRTVFEKNIMGKTLITNEAIFMPANGIIKTTVMQARNAIGYISFGYADNNVKLLSVDGIACSSDNILDGTYPVSRNLYFVTRESPTGLVKAFMDFIISADGQKVVIEQGFVPLQLG